MEIFFNYINSIFEFIVPIADFLWDFPTNMAWYNNIPILGNFSLAIVILMGAGLYFTYKTGFVQVAKFKKGVKILSEKKACETGVSPLASFLLSSAMRIGPGNIVGVTGAISIGGPGAIFWMWISAFFGMATAFVEAVLAQIYKEKKGDEFVGGLPFYGKKILGNKHWVGVALAILFIIYAMFCIPAQSFNVVTSLGSVVETITGTVYDRQSFLYYGIVIILILTVAVTVFKGIKGVIKVTDKVVPVMALVYVGLTIVIILFNLDKVPYFFTAVFQGAFKPEAIFGGAFGVALAQGIKRGLMSNEAGQGTITMAAAVADNEHPVEQGLVQALGVFLDTMVIATMTGIVVVMASLWVGETGAAWEAARASKLNLYLSSIQYLVPGTAFDTIVSVIISICYGMFAFTTLLGMIAFAEISGNFISKGKKCINVIRSLGAFVFVPFGCLTVLAGLELGNLWYISDLVNILVVYANVPILLVGCKIVFKALDNYNNSKGGRFNSLDIGIETDYWNDNLKENKQVG